MNRTSSSVKVPVISPLVVILLWIVAADISVLSMTIASVPTLAVRLGKIAAGHFAESRGPLRH